MQYRREIDGLRAVAVIPVILFHAGFDWFSGGFVGVDVFFVISGYLITSILIEDLEQGKFSLLAFYERRCRRILPALFFVMLCCIPFAWAWMLPEEFEAFGKSLIAVSLFGSNILFWRESGYFSAVSEEKPLLHTWSLAVEEQYYLIFPVFLFLTWRFGRNRVFWAIVVLSAISLVMSEWGWRNKPEANFFLAPTRAWELFAGSLAAFLIRDHGVRNSNILSGAGLLAILASIILYDHNTPFPSLYTLLPVLGVFLLILYGGAETAAAKLLSTRICVGIGLLSYSAYLWHQPLFAFARIRLLEQPSPLLMLALSLGAIGLAAFSWRYVERPFRGRNARILPARGGLLWASVGGCFGFIIVGAVVMTQPTRLEITYPDRFAEIASQEAPFASCPGFAHVRTANASCRVYGSGDRLVVIWGDSHAIPLRSAITPVDGAQIMVINHMGCPPVSGVRRMGQGGTSENCPTLETLEAYQEYIIAQQPELVFLIARWTLYQRGWIRQDILQPDTHFVSDGSTSDQDSTAQTSSLALQQGLNRTLEALGQSRTVLVAPPADLNFMDEHQRFFADSAQAARIADWHSTEDQLLQSLKDRYGVKILETRPLFCSEVSCALRRDGLPLYDDDNHLSAFGVTFQWNLMRQEIDALLR